MSVLESQERSMAYDYVTCAEVVHDPPMTNVLVIRAPQNTDRCFWEVGFRSSSGASSSAGATAAEFFFGRRGGHVYLPTTKQVSSAASASAHVTLRDYIRLADLFDEIRVYFGPSHAWFVNVDVSSEMNCIYMNTSGVVTLQLVEHKRPSSQSPLALTYSIVAC